jgi:hypothetical protein
MAERNGCGELPLWRRRSIVASLPSLALAPVAWSASPNRPVEPLRVVLDAPLGRAAEQALNELTEALRKKGLELLTQSEAPAAREPALIVGIAGASAAAGAAMTGLQPGLPAGPEALVVKNLSVKPRPLLIAGADSRGLAYALLDVARTVECGIEEGLNTLQQVKDRAQPPYLRTRSITHELLTEPSRAMTVFAAV